MIDSNGFNNFKYHLISSSDIEHVYHVIDSSASSKRACAYFVLYDATRAKIPAIKNMSVYFPIETSERFYDKQDIVYMLSLYIFIFNSMLTICHEEKGIKTFKIYAESSINQSLFKSLSEELSKEKYKITDHKRWLVIEKNWLILYNKRN